MSQHRPIQIGDLAPNFSLPSVDGTPHSLSSHRGRKVYLSFLRFASCSLCQLDIDHLKTKSEVFERGGVDVVCVFQSTPENIKLFIMKMRPPFLCLSDPAMKVYKMYNVGMSKWGYEVARWKFKYLNSPHGGKKRSAELGFLTPHEKGAQDHILPSDYLIDEGGKVVDVFRARTADEHMPWDRILRFMPNDPEKRRVRRGLRGLSSKEGLKADEEDDRGGGIYMG